MVKNSKLSFIARSPSKNTIIVAIFEEKYLKLQRLWTTKNVINNAKKSYHKLDLHMHKSTEIKLIKMEKPNNNSQILNITSC